MFKKKLIILLVLLSILSLPSFAGLSLEEEIIYVNTQHKVLKIDLSEGTSLEEGSIISQNEEEVGKVILLSDQNQVAVVPVRPLKENEEYIIDIVFSNDSETYNFSQKIIYDPNSEQKSQYAIKITDQGVVTLLKYSELTELEKIAHDILLGFTNLETTITWEKQLTVAESSQAFNYLDNQKNHLPFISLANSEYQYELSADRTEWMITGITEIEYLVDESDMETLNNKYYEVLSSLDLEKKTNKEKSEIIALELVKHFEYDYSGEADRVYLQSYFSILRDKTVCAGYAGAYSHLLNLVGIRSDYIAVNYISNNGDSIPHVYNKVYLSEDEVVYTDVTHMDKSTESNVYNYDSKFLNNFNKVFNQPNKRIDIEEIKTFSTEITHQRD